MARYGCKFRNYLAVGLLLLCVFLLPAAPVAAKTAQATAATSQTASSSNKRVVRVGLFEDTYHKVNKKGELSGYGYEYLQKIAGYEGWTIEYVEADWYTCFDKLKSGEIDILNGISYTQDRAQDMLFSALPMAEERYYIYADSRRSNVSASDLGAVAGKNMGVMMGAIPEQVLDSWETDNGLSTNHVNITTGQDVLDNLSARTMDCFVSVEEDWDQDWISPLIYIGSSDVYFAISQDRTDLKSDLDSAMARIASDDPFYNDRLYEKYFSTSATATLSQDERAWLASHGSIRVGCIKGDVNIAEVDATTGEVKGIINDYIDFAASCFGDVPRSSLRPAATTTWKPSLRLLPRARSI